MPTLLQLFWGPLANRFRQIAGWRRRGRLSRAAETARRQPVIRLEQLEPRLLLSADLSYSAGAGVIDATLRIIDDAGPVLQLLDNATDTELARATLSSGGPFDVDIQGGALDDSLTIDFSLAAQFGDVLDPRDINVSFAGGAGNDTLIGPDEDSTWDINGTDAGTLNSSIDFSDVENLSGGSLSDAFIFADGAAISGVLDAGAGVDILDYSAYQTAVAVDLAAATASGTGSALGFEQVIGGAAIDFVHGPAVGGQWDVTGVDEGEIVGVLGFSGFENLIGADGAQDGFVFFAEGSLSGAIDGGAGGVDGLLIENGVDTTLTVVNPNASPGLHAVTLHGITVRYAGLEPLIDGTTADRIINGSTYDDDLVLEAAPTPGFMQVRSQAGDFYDAVTATFTGSLVFANPAGSLTVNLGRGDDALTLAPFDAGFAPITLTISAGEGSDELIADNQANVWDITATDSGDLNGIAFDGIEEATGGTQDDMFVFADGARISGFVDGGGGGVNMLDYSVDTVGVTVYLGLNVDGITHVIGGTGDDTLFGDAVDNVWNIVGPNAGTVGGVAFSNIENLGGNVGADAFIFADAAAVTGGVDGGGGFNTLDYAAYSAGNSVTVRLGSGAVTGLGSVANIQDIKGGQSNADTLIGPDANAEWHITGPNAGTVLGITFAGFENVTGAANNEDAFIFRPGGSLTGTLNGGAGGLDALAIEDPSSTDPTPKVLTAVVPNAAGAGIQAFGDIYPGDARSVSYTGMDPYFHNAGGVADALIRTSVFGETLFLEDGPGPTELQLRVTSAVLGTPFGSIEFWNPVTSALIGPIIFEIPTSSLTIETRAGSDSLTVTTSRLTNVADLDITLEAGNLIAGSFDEDEIRLSSNILTRGGDLMVIAETVIVSAGTILSTRDAVGNQATATSLGASGDIDIIGHSISVEDGAQLLSFDTSGAADPAGLPADVVVQSVELERPNIFGEQRKIWEPGRSYTSVGTVTGAGSAGSGMTLDIITDTEGNPTFRIHDRGSGYAIGDTVDVRILDLKDASLNFLESKLLELFGGAEDSVIATLEVSDLVVEGGDVRLSAIHKTNAVGSVFGIPLFPDKAHVSAEITIGSALVHGRDVILRAEADNNDRFNGELEAGKQKFDGVLDFLSEVRPLVGISDVSATATITIGAGAVILADEDAVIEARADSAAEIRTLGIVGGFGYARTEANATLSVEGGATVAAVDDVAITSIANNTITANISTGNLIAKIPVDIAVGVTEAYSSAVTRVEQGATIDAGGRADIWAIHTKDLASEVSTSANFGMLGVGVLVALSDADSVVEVAGNVTAVDAVSLIAQTVSTQNQSQVASTIGLGLLGKFKKKITNAGKETVLAVKDLIFGKQDQAPNTRPIPQSMKNSKFGLTAAVVVAEHENSASATIASGAVVLSDGEVSVLADVVDRPVISAASAVKKGFDRIVKTNFDIQKAGAVSAAVEIGTYTNDAHASIAEGAQVDAQRGVVVAAHTLVPQDAPWANFFANDGAGAGAAVADTLLDLFIGTDKAFSTSFAKASSDAKKVGLAGAVTVFNNRASAEAVIADGALVNQNPDPLWALDQQHVTVSSDTSVESVNLSGNLGGSAGGTGIGGAYSGAFYDTASLAVIGSDAHVSAGGDISVTADTNVRNFSIGISGGKAGKVAVNGAVNTVFVDSSTIAQIDDGAVVSAGGTIDVAATDKLFNLNIAGGITKGSSAGVGISVGVSDIYRDTQALIGNREAVLGRGEYAPNTGVNGRNETIDLGYAHGFATGDSVVYNTSGDEPVGGLQDGGTYVVSVINPTTIKLARSIEEATDAAATRFGAGSVIDGAGENQIDLGYQHGYQTGDAVRYTNGGGESIGGLVDGKTYFVIRVDDQRIQLAEFIEETEGELFAPIDLDTSLGGSGSDHALRLDLDPLATGDVAHKVGRAFDPAADVIDTAETIDLGYAHGFKNGQAVLYRSSGDTPIQGLEDGKTYYVVSGSNPSAFQLAGSEQDALAATPTIIDIDATGIAGTLHGFGVAFEPAGTIVPQEGAAGIPVVDTTANSINLGYEHGFSSGDAVVYSNGGGTDIVGLTNGATYYVVVVDDATIKLSDNALDPAGNVLDIDATDVTGAAHTLHAPIAPAAAVNGLDESAVDTINLGYSHGFTTGQAVMYSHGGGDSIGGLENKGVYYVIVVDSDTVRLAVSEQDALDGVFIDLDSAAATGAAHSIGALFRPVPIVDGDADTIRFDGAHGLRDGQPLVYGNGGGASIGGLIDGTTYYADVIDGQTIRLARTALEAADDPVTYFGLGDIDPAAETIDLGYAHGYQVGDTLVYHNGGGNDIGGLTDGMTYYAVGVSGNGQGVSLSLTQGGAPVDLSNLTGTGTQHSLRLSIDPTAASGSAHTLTEPDDVTGSLNAIGKTTVHALNEGLLITPAIAGAATTGPDKGKNAKEAGGGKFGIGFSGSASANTVTDITKAYVRDALITGSAGLSLDAHEETRIIAVGGSAALSLNSKGSAGIAGAVTVNTIDNTTHAFIENSLLLNVGALDVTSDASGRITSVAAGLSGSPSGAGVAGSVAIDTVRSDTSAFVSGSEIIDASTVSIDATDSTRIITVAGAVTFGGKAGVGLSVSVNTVDTQTSAYISDSDVAATGDVVIAADADNRLVGVTAAIGASKGSMAGAASVSVNVLDMDTTAHVSGKQAAGLATDGNVLVSAKDAARLTLIAGSAAATRGTAGVGISTVVLVRDNDTSAYVGGAARIDAKGNTGNFSAYTGEADDTAPDGLETIGMRGVAVNAISSENLLTIAAGGAGAQTAGVAGSAVVNVSNDTTQAYVGNGAEVNRFNDGTEDASQKVLIAARDDTSIISVAGAVAFGGSAGLGAAADVGVLTKQTLAFIDSGAIVNAADDVVIRARSSDDVISVAATLGFSQTVAIAGAASVYVVNTTTESSIADTPSAGSPAQVHAGGDVHIDARGDADFLMVAGNVAGTTGTASVGISAAVLVHNDRVEAFVGDDAMVDAKGAGASAKALTGQMDDAGTLLTMDVNGLVITATSYEETLVIAAGGAGAGTAGVSGSAVVQVLNETTRARIGAGAQINTTNPGTDSAVQDVYVLAGDDTSTIAVGGSLAFGGSAGVGIGASIGVINKTTEASVGARTTINARDTVSIEALSNEDVIAVAGSIAGGGSAGIGGSATVFVVNTKTRAFVEGDPAGPGADIDAGGNVLIAADGNSDLLLIAGSIGGGGTAGVGLSNTTLVKNDLVEAFVGEHALVEARGETSSLIDVRTGKEDANGVAQTVSLSGIGITATSTEDLITIAAGGAGGGSAGIAGSAVVNVVNEDTHAYIGAGAEIDAVNLISDKGPSVVVLAADRTGLFGLGGGLGGGGAFGVGAGVDVGVISKDTRAYVGATANVDAENQVIIQALSTESWLSIAAGIGGGGSIGVAGAASVYVLNNQTLAYIEGTQSPVDRTRVHTDGSLLVSSENDTSALMVAGSIAGAGAVSVGLSAAVPVAVKHTEAYIGEHADVAALAMPGKDAVQAHTGEFQVDRPVDSGGEFGPSFDPAEAVAGDEITFDYAHGFENGQKVVYSNGGGSNLGGLVDGTAYFVVVVDNTRIKLARDAGGTDIVSLAGGANGKNHSLKGQVVDRSGFDPDLDGDGVSDLGSGFGDDYFARDRTASAMTQAVEGIAVTAISKDDFKTFGISGGGAGTVAVNIGGTVHVMNSTTLAHIDDGAIINDAAGNAAAGASQSVLVAAGSDYRHWGIAGGVSLSGVVSVAPGADVTVFTTLTEAYIGNADVAAKGDVAVLANSTQDIFSIAGSVAGSGTVSVAGSASVQVINNQTHAYIGNNVTASAGGEHADIDAGGNVLVDARDDTRAFMIAGSAGIGIGAAGIGASAGVIVVNKDTDAHIGDFAEVDAKANSAGTLTVFDGVINANHGEGLFAADANSFGTKSAKGVAVQASSQEDVFSIAAAGAGGLYAGVAGGVAVSVVGSDTTAHIGANARINQDRTGVGAGQGVNVAAVNNFEVLSVGGGVGVGAGAVGGGVDVGVVRNNTAAYIQAGAAVSASAEIEVHALAAKDIDSAAFSAAGGLVSLAGSVSVWSIGSAFDDSYEVDDGDDTTNDTTGALPPQQIGFVDAQVSGDDPDNGTGSDADGADNGWKSVLSGYSPQSEAGKGTQQATDGINQEAPPGDEVSTAIGEPVPGTKPDGVPTGTVAFIGTGAMISAGDSVVVHAEENIDFDVLAGSAAAGVAGIGGSVAVANIRSNTDAHIASGAILSAGPDLGDDVLVTAHLTETAAGRAYAGRAGGLVIGAQVVVINDDSAQRAYIDDGAIIAQADTVIVSATSDRTVGAEAIGGGVGGLSAGAAVAVANLDGITRAFVEGSVTANDLDVVAGATAANAALSIGVSAGGGGALGASVATASVDPDIEAYIGANAVITLTGDAHLDSSADAQSSADAVGVNVALGGGLGASVAFAMLTPGVSAYIGPNATLNTGNDVSLRARSNVGSDGSRLNKGARASATSGSGGIVVGGAGAFANVDVAPTVETYIDTGSVVIAGHDVQLLSQANSVTPTLTIGPITLAGAQASGAGFGAIGVGVSVAGATIGGTIDTHIGTATVSAGNDIGIASESYADASASAQAVSGGIIGVGVNSATVTVNPVIEAYIGGSADIDAVNDVRLTSRSEADGDAEAKGLSVGIGVSIGVSLANVNINPEVSTYIGAGATVDAGGDVLLRSLHNVDGAGGALAKGASATGAASGGGILSGNGADANATSDAIVKSYVATGMTVATIDAGGDVTIEAFSNNDATATGNGLTIGVVGIGVVLGDARSDGETEAYLGAGTLVTAGAGFVLETSSQSRAVANTVASGGGVAAGQGAHATAAASPNGSASIGAGARVQAGQDARVATRSTNNVTATSGGGSFGGLAVGVSLADANVAGSAATNVESDAMLIAGGDVSVETTSSDNAAAVTNANAGGVLGGAGADSDADVTRTISLAVGDRAQLGAGQDVDVSTRALVRSGATATGVAASGGAGVGSSSATASETVNVSALLGGAVDIDAGRDIAIEAVFNIDQAGAGLANALTATSTGSAGSLIAGVLLGADAVVTSTVNVDTTVGTGSTLDALNDIIVVSGAYNTAHVQATGNAGGLFASGGGGSGTSASADIDTTADTVIATDAQLIAGHDEMVASGAVTIVTARATGASGQNFGSAFENLLTNGLTGFFAGDNIPSILSNGGTLAKVTVDNTASTEIHSGARLEAGNALSVTASGETVVDAFSTMSGASAFIADAVAVSDVVIDSDALIRLHDGAFLVAEHVEISAHNQVDARSESDADVTADIAQGTVTAISRLNFGSLADPSEAKVNLGAANITGRESVIIEAVNNQKTGPLLSKATGEAFGGITSTASALSEGTAEVRSRVESSPGMVLTTADLTVNSDSNYVLQRDPFAKADTVVTHFVEQVKTVQRTIEQRVCRHLPWPLNVVCRTVTRVITETIIVVVEVADFSSEFTRRGGTGLSEQDSIALEGDIFNFGAGNVQLIINADGSIDPSSNIGATIAGGDIFVDPIVSGGTANIRFQTPAGTISGAAVLHLSKVIGEVSVINHSDLNLVFGTVNAVANGGVEDVETNPDVEYLSVNIHEFDIDSEIVESRLDVLNHGSGDVLFTESVRNVSATFSIVNEGGDILQSTGVLFEVGDVGSMAGGDSITLDAAAGSIGTAGNPFNLRLVRGQLMPDGTVSHTPVILSAFAGQDVFLDVTGVNNTFAPFDPTDRVDGIQLNVTAGSDVDVAVSASEVLDDQVISHSVDGIYDFRSVAAGTGDVVVNVQAGDLNVGSVNALSGTASLAASGSIFDADNDAASDVTALNVLLNAVSGQIGTAANSLEVDSSVTGAGLVTVTAQGDVYLTETAGDLRIARIASATGDARLGAMAGSVVDGEDDTAADVEARSITVLAMAGGVGAQANALEIDSGASMPGLVTVGAAQGVHLNEVAGDLLLDRVTSAAGDVGLAAAASILDGASDTESDVDGVNISLVATAGGIGTDTDDLEIDSGSAALGTARASAALSIYLAETAGDMTLGQVLSTAGGVRLTAAAGAIRDDNDAGTPDISAMGAELVAGSGIGEAANALETEISTLDADAGAGGIWIVNDGAITLGDVVAAGTVSVVALSPLTVAGNVSGAEIYLEAADTPAPGDDLTVASGAAITALLGPVTLVAGDDLTVSAATITAMLGPITLMAGDNLTVQAGAIITSMPGPITLVAGNDLVVEAGSLIETDGSVFLSAGGNLQLSGTIIAGSMLITGDDDDNVIAIRNLSSDTTVQTRGGNDTVVLGSLAPGLGGTLEGFIKALIVDAGIGNDILIIDDSGDIDSDESGTLTANEFSGFGMLDTVTYHGFETLELSLGSGDDDLQVLGTMRRDDFRTVTVINTGAGHDEVTVSLDAEVDGLTAIDLQAGDDFLDGTASSLGLLVFGGEGSDTVLGGSGADTIIGDLGVVDYGDAGGALITRLGVAPSERIANPADPHFVPLPMTDGGFHPRAVVATRDPDTGAADVLHGNGGDDLILGGAGSDTIDAGGDDGGDTVIGDGAHMTFGGTAAFGAGEKDAILSFNFTGKDRQLGITGAAGAALDPETGLPAGNWNNLAGGGPRTYGNDAGEWVRFDDGRVAPGVTIKWGADLDSGKWRDPDDLHEEDHSQIIPGSDQDKRLFDGYLSSGHHDTVGVNLAGLSGHFNSYDVYVYLDMDDQDSRSGASVRSITDGTTTFYLDDPDGNTFTGTYVEVTSTDPNASQQGNYVVFRGLTGDSVSLRIDDHDPRNSSNKPGVAAVQVVGARNAIDRIETLNADSDGDDTIVTGGGADIVFGGGGNDTIETSASPDGGGSDNDIVVGDYAQGTFVLGELRELTSWNAGGAADQATGDDIISTGNGNDVVIGGNGADHIAGGGGDDVLLGDNAWLLLHGGEIVGLASGDQEHSGHHHHHDDDNYDFDPYNVPGIELLHPGIGGGDIIEGGTGDDLMYGQFGDDIYVFAGGGLGRDAVIEAGIDHGHHVGPHAEHGPNDEHDVLDFSLFAGPVEIELDDAREQTVNGGRTDGNVNLKLTLFHEDAIEHVIGSEFSDEIEGNSRDNILIGRAGNDELEGKGGNDVLLGMDGDDELEGDEGDDFLAGGEGNDDLEGDSGDDILIGGAGHDELEGGDGDDVLVGGAGNDELEGGAGDDLLLGGEGDDELEGDSGNDILAGGAGNDELDGDSGNDVLLGGAGDDELDGDSGDDQLFGGDGNDELDGDSGQDLLAGGEGRDELDGGSDADQINRDDSDKVKADKKDTVTTASPTPDLDSLLAAFNGAFGPAEVFGAAGPSVDWEAGDAAGWGNGYSPFAGAPAHPLANVSDFLIRLSWTTPREAE